MRTLIDERRHEEYLEQRKKGKEPLPMALRELPNPYNPMREEGMGLCSSKEELNKLIHSLNYRIEHENISIVEKRQLMKKIYRLEGTRKRVIENDFMKAKMQDSKSNSQDQALHGISGAKRKEMEPLYTSPGDFRNAINAVSEKDMGLDSSEDELIELMHSLNYGIQNGSIMDDRELRKAIRQLGGMRRRCLEKLPLSYRCNFGGVIENSSMKAKMQDSRSHVQGQDITGLEALSGAEFSSYKEFREDYERRILSSEKPISLAKAPRPNESEMPEQEETNEAVESGANGKVEIILEDSEEWIVVEKYLKSSHQLLELKREEGLAKAN
ncbi:Proton pump-interactor 1 [Acorus calamus]|uniref:Proton pump-interactor 1 n=1 Tax=Acorus calamus TaxID=4465 RepID=A0AAV9DQD2_ACOCL|nr:Proton pump-interactor 1 [Acorus calamus]